MPDYSQGKIYKLTCSNEQLVYIGSTTQTLEFRLIQHKCDADRGNGVTSSELFNYDDVTITLLENCDTKERLTERERFHIESNECINKYIPGRTDAERYLANKEAIAERHRLYDERNKDAIAERKKTYYLSNKETILERQILYKESNRDTILERQKIWRDSSPRVECPCGGQYKQCNMTKHVKTKIHTDYLATLNNSI